MNSNRKNKSTYVLVGSLTALGGLALGITGSWIYNKFSKKEMTLPKLFLITLKYNQLPQNKEPMEYIYKHIDENDTIFLTNEEFQKYFEDTINSNHIDELEECLLEYALELDPMNLRFFKDFQKTLDFQKLAVRQNINTIVYCRSTEEQYNIQTQSNTTNEDEILTYKKYEIHDYAFELYGNDIYKYIDHPEGYSYEEIMGMPPPEFKDMTVSEVFNTLQNQNKTEVPPLPDIKDIVNEHIPDVMNIEFTNEISSSDEETN